MDSRGLGSSGCERQKDQAITITGDISLIQLLALT